MNSGRLENKNGNWMYMEESWILPKESFPEGDIRDSLGRVLKANLESRGMHLKLKHKIICTVELY